MDIYNGTYHRLILMTLNYRIMGAVVTALIVFAFTGKLALSISIGAVCLIVKAILYYLHENLWVSIDSRKSKPQQ